MPVIHQQLSDEQMRAVERLLEFEKPAQTLGGFAGSGKTTMIRTMAEQLGDFAVCAYTGKAANVLRRKGVPATTIHSLIYRPVEVIGSDGKRKVEFQLKDDIECDDVIVDEASMVGRAIYDDLRTFGVPLIFVGDHGQLPPVCGGEFNLMARPDIVLEKVHRNAGEIARFAEHLRKGNPARTWRGGKQVQLLPQRRLLQDIDGVPDQLICGFNRTRVALNRWVRECPDAPKVGDWVMCLQNEHRLGLYNGMQGEIVKLEGKDRMVFEADGLEYPVRYVPEQFNSVRKPDGRDRQGRLPFDYCYAITAHKAQGDEWDHVCVFEERCPLWQHQRWSYTAASRARRQLTWVTN